MKTLQICILTLIIMTGSTALLHAQATFVWDAETTAGYQNADGTWGSDSFWSPSGGIGAGTSLSAWTAGDNAWFGGNSGAVATPAGDFTVTVSGTQQVSLLRQIVNGSGNYTLAGGSLTGLEASGIRADYGLFTVNSDVSSSAQMQLNAAGGDIVLGGNNNLTGNIEIRGSANRFIRLDHSGALGSGNTVFFVNSLVDLDLNGNAVSGNNILVNPSQTGFLTNSSLTDVVWSGNVGNNGAGTHNLRAGGQSGAGSLEINGVVSISGQLEVRDGGELRLSGANTHTGLTVVRNSGTLVVGNDSALGSAAAGTFVNAGGTIDLNGSDVGTEAFTLQQSGSKLENSNASAAQTSGALNLIGSSHTIGGIGDITFNGAANLSSSFEKIGANTVSFGDTVSVGADLTVSGGTLAFLNGSTTTFAIGADGVNESILGTGALSLDGILAFDLSSADTTIGASWLIFDADSLTENIGVNFSVQGFNDEGSGLWTLDNGALYEFEASTGALSVVPEPSSYALLLGCAICALVGLRRR
jgi:autotransporter-associated beta strand protein